MKINGFLCDCGCGANDTTPSHETKPAGWFYVSGPDHRSYYFASWSCIANYVKGRTSMPAPLEPQS